MTPIEIKKLRSNSAKLARAIRDVKARGGSTVLWEREMAEIDRLIAGR